MQNPSLKPSPKPLQYSPSLQAPHRQIPKSEKSLKSAKNLRISSLKQQKFRPVSRLVSRSVSRLVSHFVSRQNCPALCRISLWLRQDLAALSSRLRQCEYFSDLLQAVFSAELQSARPLFFRAQAEHFPRTRSRPVFA